MAETDDTKGDERGARSDRDPSPEQAPEAERHDHAEPAAATAGSGSDDGGEGSGRDPDPEAEGESSKRWAPTRKTLITIGVAGVTALVAAIGSGLGNRALSLFDSDPPPPPEPVLVSSSDAEELQECGTHLFAPEPVDQELLAAPPPPFDQILTLPGVRRTDRSVVDVSIQGESERTITLMGIDFDVERKQRPPGASFGLPCGDANIGRQVVVNLERDPPAIVGSADDPEGIPGALDANGEPYPKIDFPWTVSITDPLLLKIVAWADTCVCTWTATIPWVSGGKRGELVIDNSGEGGYVTVGQNGIPTYTAGNEAWEKFRSPPSVPVAGQPVD